jgi:hypothetical protein
LEAKLTEEEVMQKEKHNLANKGEVNSTQYLFTEYFLHRRKKSNNLKKEG